MSTDSRYRSGLQARHEAVVSAHFMHEQNLNTEYELYSDSDYTNASLTLPISCFQQELLPALKLRRQEVAQLRAHAAIKRATPDACSAIAELVLDRWFRKGAKDNINITHLKNQITKALVMRAPVRLVAPLLPFKKDCPLKTRGTHACMAEIDLLCRLGEMTEAISLIRQHYNCPAENGADAVFTVLGDGQRFLTSLNIDIRDVMRYQLEVFNWIELLGLNHQIEIDDYESFVRERLSKGQRAQREMLRLNALGLYQSCMAPLFDADDMEGSLQKAIAADPLPDASNSEGRFVPLFKSILYTHQYNFLHDYCLRHKADFADVYREVTLSTLGSYPALSPEQYHAVYAYVHGTSDVRPDNGLIIGYLRRQVLQAAWHATISYLSVVKMDRDLMDDPIASLLPDHIRYTIHAKPGQIGLRTTTSTKSGSVVQPWHGVSMLRPDGCNRLKFDTVSRLQAEGIGARPVILSAAGCGTCPAPAEHPVQQLMANQQPFFYLHPEIKAQDCTELMQRIEAELTRKVN